MAGREFALIDRYFAGLTPAGDGVTLGIGDDAAVLALPGDQELLATVDTLVSGVHFSPRQAAGDIGFKSLAVSASDIAAMGGMPRWATLALTMPALKEAWLADFARGFAEMANSCGITLVGGDTMRGPLSVTVPLLGAVTRGRARRRGGAAPGDLIYVSGYPGAAGLALQWLREEAENARPDSYCTARLHRPRPRLALGERLAGLASAAIDVSDGLAPDLGHILKASRAAARVELAQFPQCGELAALADRRQAWRLALSAGDDYELCFTLPPQKRDALVQQVGDLDYPVTCIGTITEGEGIRCLDGENRQVSLDLEGFQHF